MTSSTQYLVRFEKYLTRERKEIFTLLKEYLNIYFESCVLKCIVRLQMKIFCQVYQIQDQLTWLLATILNMLELFAGFQNGLDILQEIKVSLIIATTVWQFIVVTVLQRMTKGGGHSIDFIREI